MSKNIINITTTIIFLTIILIAGMIIESEIDIFSTKEKIVSEDNKYNEEKSTYSPYLDCETPIINVVEQNTPAVVSIISSKFVDTNNRVMDEFFFYPYDDEKTEERAETGRGTGFIFTEDGFILTNRHIVYDQDAKYEVIMHTGEKYDAKVIAIDPMQDLAVLKIEGENFPTIKIGDSDSILLGQTAIAIGNALGELENTISVGVISGLGRQVSATGAHGIEILSDVIQTDAAINFGNSGGPLLNLKGEVVGVNTAIAMRAEGIGFAIPINKAQRAMQGAVEEGKIAYPFLGIRYLIVNDEMQQERNLPIDYGALIISGGRGNPAIEPNSAADRAGLQEGDIVTEFDGEQITEKNSLATIINNYHPQDEVLLKIIRNEEEKQLSVVLGEIEG